MKYTRVLALLAAMFVSGIHAQAQQEVDPTSYPLTPAVAHSSDRPAPRTVKRSSTHPTQHSATKKTQKSSAGAAQHDAAKGKTIAKR